MVSVLITGTFTGPGHPMDWIVATGMTAAIQQKSAPREAPLSQWLEVPYFANSNHQPEPTPSTIQRRPQLRSK